MKICIFNGGRLGIVDRDEVVDCTYLLNRLKVPGYPLPRHDLLIEALPSLRGELEAALADAPRLPLNQVSLESPVANPGKLVAAPVNYQAHLDEAIADEATFSRGHVRKIQETGLFLKATSSLVGASADIVIGFPDRRTDHEIELAVVIGKTAKNVRAAEALDYVAGYCIGLDITIRGPEERSLRKSLDTYSVLGPWLVTSDELSDATNLDLALDVNGEPRQRANTRDLIMTARDLIEFASSFYTLEPGDVLFTGTPEGVGPIRPGDTVSASISKIGNIKMVVK
ncbi:fumarylacetoacetate hydrolase family protein [Caballeronia sp. LjRoot34]|uniref:fumarylacetoacetate hydrolase family protein n=1 Tax=Caballeronia sp. LjRoot34 TaxID=3342325 RepID=UPI003ED02F35